MARSINNKQTWNIYIHFKETFTFIHLLNQFFLREKCGTNLLGNTSSFSLLNVSVSNFIQECSFSSINMAQNTTYWTSKFSNLSSKIISIIFKNSCILFLLLFLFIHHMLNLFLRRLFIIFNFCLFGWIICLVQLLSLSL